MNRLEAELQRLGLAPVAPDAGTTRALLLEILRPAGWEPVGQAWQGVQADLDLPAPAIAVNGRDGYQLWFAFPEPVATTEAQAFFDGLRARYLAGVPPERLRLGIGGLPLAQQGPERWAAFVAPDLAPIFAEEPWLDLAPSADAQAELLSRLQPIQPPAFQRAMERLRPAAPAAPVSSEVGAATSGPSRTDDPRRFLLQVMNDPAVDLRLRIEAAKALLPSGRDR
jgi:hypothetical protein